MYASFLRISRALHLVVFEEPAENYFFNNLLVPGKIMQVDLRIKSFMKKNMKNLKFPKSSIINCFAFYHVKKIPYSINKQFRNKGLRLLLNEQQ